MESCLVITNEGAGTADQESLDRAVAVLSDRSSIEVVSTSNPGELDGVLHRAGTRRIVVAGGDGSLHAVVAALHRRNELADHVLGLIPLGTGNDFARCMDVPLDPEEAARLVIDGEVRPVDLLVDELGGIVVNNVHVGAGAQASRRGHRWKHRLGSVGVGRVNLGKLGYPIGALLAAFHPPQLRLRVEVDGKVVVDFDDPVLMVAAGNGTSVGGGTELTPEADPEDGKVDVMISRAVGPVAKFVYVAHLSRSRHHERDDVTYLRGSRVTVSGEEFYCSADGEIIGPERHRSWRVLPAAYSMALP
ncbi:diacylglycerol/lipid kinase family protein [Nocardioides sp.]|uniref:diacylglycerol/lipid kinase family protein n=1 Tax=Nocardioides sp. TaxID=35761 RepID=UPI002ED0EB63